MVVEILSAIWATTLVLGPVSVAAQPPFDGVSLLRRSFLDDPVSPQVSESETVRLLDGFVVPVVLDELTRSFVDFYKTRGKATFARSYARMGIYDSRLSAVLAREGLPPELAAVPFIESGFDTSLSSPAGAEGPWQIVPRTAVSLGLRRDDWVDERRDFERSTEAAVRYLKSLHQDFGSWPLALAAYNAGPGAVSEALKRGNTNDYSTLLKAGALPGRSHLYVAKAMAAMIVLRQPARFGFGDIVREVQEPVSGLLVPGGVTLKDLARRIDVPLAHLIDLNPALRRAQTPPGPSDFMVIVPAQVQARAAERLDLKGLGGQVFIEHRVRFGERLWDIAADSGATHGDLRRLNDLPQGEPRPGQTILVPNDQGVPGQGHGRSHSPAPLLVRSRAAAEVRPGGRREVFFPIRDRMDVGEIAAFFGVSLGDIGLWNDLDPGVPLRRGMVLRLLVEPSFDTSSAVLIDPAELTPVKSGSAAAELALTLAGRDDSTPLRRQRYVVRRGDTLWVIASRFGTALDSLCAENGLTKASSITPGQVLNVPIITATKPGARGGRRGLP